MRLVLRNISKKYDCEILKGITFAFESGKIYVIKGVSGCGKTTLLNILGGLDPAFDGKRICYAERIAYVFQKSLLLSGLTVEENLQMIRNDKDIIRKSCEGLGIEALLGRLPSQLSGGERQRVSIARAMLNDPQILLADEPTASLDGTNSRQIAELLASLRCSDRIIIIATHESCFDDLADQILQLHYGSLLTLQTENIDRAEAVSKKKPYRRRKWKSREKKSAKPLLRLAIKHHSDRFRLRYLLPFAMACFIMLIAGAFEKNYSREARRFSASKYPMDVIVLGRDKIDTFPYQEELTVYDYLTIQEEGISAYYLMQEKDSVFHVKGMLRAGSFPINDNEVIITQEAARLLFPSQDPVQCIGEKIKFCGKTWIVAAITNDQERLFKENLQTDTYYMVTDSAAIFIKYSVLAELTEPSLPFWDSYSVMCVLDGLGLDPDKQKVVEEAKTIEIQYANGQVEKIRDLINPYYQMIDFKQQEIDRSIQRFYLVFVLLSVLFSVYTVAVTRTELFYRKKELGYLQIFGLSKKETERMIISEYSFRVAAGHAVAYSLFIASVVLYRVVFGAWAWPNKTAIVLGFLFTGTYMLFVWATVRCFLRKSVLNLIN